MSDKNILEEIIINKRAEVEEQKRFLSLEQIKEKLPQIIPSINFEKALQECIVRGRVALIAEIKKASPSKGVIRPDFNPVEIATIYESCGAAAISVLTDEKYFQGSLEYLRQVVSNVHIPVLRKDFIIDPYQIYQSRYYGADVILLISEILTRQEFKEFYELSSSLGMSCLVETHTEEEFDYHLNNNTRIIGINNRDLKTFKTDLNHTIKLLEHKHPCKSFIISESGISSFEDILKLSNAGVTGILVGEYFMRENNISQAIKKLMGF